MRRLLVAAVLAVVTALTLSSCSLWKDGEKIVGQWQQGAAANEVLSELTESLRARDDVESAEASAVPITMSASVSVVMRPTATPAAMGEVTVQVDTALRGPKLQPFKREFVVSSDDAEIRQLDFAQAPIDYTAELEYWGAVRSAVGPGLTLSLGPGRGGSLLRLLSTQSAATVVAIADNFAAITALAPPTGTDTLWQIPGVGGYQDARGSLPDIRSLRFLAKMSTLTNLLDDANYEPMEGVAVGVPQSATDAPAFQLVMIPPQNEKEAAANRKLRLAMVETALDTGLPAFQVFAISLDDSLGGGAHLYRGGCKEVYPTISAGDRELVTELAATGADLTDVAPGICITFSTPNS